MSNAKCSKNLEMIALALQSMHHDKYRKPAAQLYQIL